MDNQISSQHSKLPLFYRNLPAILLIVIIIIAGGIFAWHHLEVPAEEVVPVEEVIKEEIIEKQIVEEQTVKEVKIKELKIIKGWLRVLDYQVDVNNDGIDEFFIIEESREPAPLYKRAYDIVAFFKDGEKLIEVWRRQVVLWKQPVEAISISIGDLDKNGINEILIMVSGAPGHEPIGWLYEYNKDVAKFNKFNEVMRIIIERKKRDIKNFRFWSFEGIGDYDQDGVNEILTRYYWIDEVTAGIGLIIPIFWEEIKEEKRRIEEEVKVPEEGDIPFRTLESDEKLTEYLIKNTDLLEGTRFTFVRIEESIAFFTFHPYRMASRGLIQIKEDSSGSLVLLEGLTNICNCLSVRDVHTKRLIHNQPEFIIFDFWPKAGTCVAGHYFHISKIYENRFKDLWRGSIFRCPGQGSVPEEWTSDIATIEFKDLNNDKNFEIVRTGYTIKCGDMCCCEKGPKKPGSEFEQIFIWDEQVGDFVEK